MSQRIKLLCLSLCMLLILGVTASAQLESVLKVGGITLLVTQYGKQINSAINKVTKTPENDEKFGTKVVPILSGGDGKEIGAAQVMGPKEQVEKVQAVAQIEGKFNPLGMRFRGLVPVSTKNVKEIKRVTGVGISGLLDVKF
jgi:hypothetical protein